MAPYSEGFEATSQELAARQNLLAADGHKQMKDKLEEIARMLSGPINGLENREK